MRRRFRLWRIERLERRLAAKQRLYRPDRHSHWSPSSPDAAAEWLVLEMDRLPLQRKLHQLKGDAAVIVAGR